MKFKVGDRVERIREEYSYVRIGDKGTVTEDSNDFEVKVKFDGRKEVFCGYITNFKLIPESPEIEVGDEVEIIDKEGDTTDYIGRKIIVTSINKNEDEKESGYDYIRSAGNSSRFRHRCRLVRKASKIKEATMDKELKIMESKVKEVMAMCPEWKKGLEKLFEGQIKEEKTYRIGMRFKNVKDEYIIASTATTPTGTTHVIMVSLKEWPGCRQGDGVEVKSAFNITESEMSSWLGSDWKDKWELISE